MESPQEFACKQGQNYQAPLWKKHPDPFPGICWSLKCPHANMHSMGNKQQELGICVELQGYLLQPVGMLLGSQGSNGITGMT